MAHWRAKNRGWWDERAVYWRSLPPPGTLWREITLTDDQLRLLQDERLVRGLLCYTLQKNLGLASGLVPEVTMH